MFTNKTKDGKNNFCGAQVQKLRKAQHWSQRQLADRLQLQGLDLDKNAIQRMEAGLRFVTDIELLALSKAFEVPLEILFWKDE